MSQGGVSAIGTLDADVYVRDKASKGGRGRAAKYADRDRWIQFLGRKMRNENPGQTEQRIAQLVRDEIARSEDEREFGQIPGDNLATNINQVIELCQVNGEIISADHICKIIREK